MRLSGLVVEFNRDCMDCGQQFVAKVDKKTKKVMGGEYWGRIPYVKRSWARWISPEKRVPVSRWAKFWGRYIWWIDDDSAFKCLHPVWQRPFILAYDSIIEYLHRGEQLEMWSCPTCAAANDLKAQAA